MDLFRTTEYILDQMRTHEIHALPVPNYDVASHNDDSTDANPHADSAEHHVANRSGVHILEVCRHIDFGDAVEIAYAAVHNEAAALGSGHDVVEEVVPDDPAAYLFSEEIDDKNIAGLKHVNGGLIISAGDAALFVVGSCP